MGILVIVAGVLIHDIYQLHSAYNDAVTVDAKYAIGPDDATLTVVEFISYTCPHCQDAHPVIRTAAERDGKIRHIPRPISGDDEQAYIAASLVYAAAEQGKFEEFHRDILVNKIIVNEQAIQDLTLQYGIDAEQLKADMDSQKVKDLIEQNHAIFYRLGGHATPSYLMKKGTLFIPDESGTSPEDFLEMFNQARG